MLYWSKKLLHKWWPVILIILTTAIYFYYLLIDSRYFFYDDFTAFTFVVPRSYTRIIIDSLNSRDIDRHKIVGYLLTKLLYHTVGTNVDYYFAVLFAVHTANSLLVYALIKRLTNNPKLSTIMGVVFAYRFYLWWFSNIHTLLAAGFSLIVVHLWLNFLNHRRLIYLLGIWLILPFLVYSYGPGFFVIPALVCITIFFKGWRNSLPYLKSLFPLIALLILYFLVYTHAANSLDRFANPKNPYYRPLTLATIIFTHSQYLQVLTGFLPLINWLSVPFYGLVAVITWVKERHLLWWLAAFLISIAPNSFFPNHTMFYYLYFPIIFITVFFAYFITNRRGIWVLPLFLIVFNPLFFQKQFLFRLRHPARHFEKQAMAYIIRETEAAIDQGKTFVRLNNWDVTPNLSHAITYQALPLFMSHPQKFNYSYSYDRTSEILFIKSISPAEEF